MAQETATDSLTLENILSLAMENNPLLNQYRNQWDITDLQVKSGTSGWLPQLGVAGEYNRYFSQPVAIFPDFNDPGSGRFQEVRTGVPFNSSLNFSVNQALFNNDLVRIRAQSNQLRKQAAQSIEEFKIDLVVAVARAFYEVLLAQEQVSLTEEDLNRQKKQVEDAQLLFEAGLTDQVDYKRALITLQNSQSALFQYKEEIKVKKAQLKTLTGLSTGSDFGLRVSYEELLDKISADTLDHAEPEQRIEYGIINTQKSIQQAELSYQKRTFLPSLSALYNYNILFLSPVGSQLFDRSYPYSFIGLRLNYPIFQGGKRTYDVKAAGLQLRNLELEQENLKNEIKQEYQTALSNYKNQLYILKTQELNRELAEEIYEVVSMQYEEGIKNFLEVIVAETDLRTSRINYYRALFGVLTGKLDLERARGEIITDY